MGAVCPTVYPLTGLASEGFWHPESRLPEECTGKDFIAGFKTEMAFDRGELVTTAAAVVVTTDPTVDREVMFAFFVMLSGGGLDTGNIGTLHCSFIHKSFLLLLP